ncbi:ArsR/SmtB family transcription factor [Agromyces archimandritae]|uniref:Helix-turn-helix transcriptional regulator n=1 Tax=Agromyces archimandritae TaxID=2781962 RepID=A0A975INJ4_9MICO|nr:helix-turn-helix domain-containing protein [Agromyces archimandritae]QTX04673.1 helix-turn-helix transcriptional regulator [Agromyces archimandritae]
MEAESRDPQTERSDGIAGIGVVKALAHPVRFDLFNALTDFGPATASGLAERLGESSGSTSYHLRELAKHGLVREVEGRGTARERWWERVPGPLRLASGSRADPVVREVSDELVDRWNEQRAAQLEEFVRRGDEVLEPEWASLATFTTSSLRLTRAEFDALITAYDAWLQEQVAEYRGRDGVPGARPVQIQFNAFPLIDRGAAS